MTGERLGLVPGDLVRVNPDAVCRRKKPQVAANECLERAQAESHRFAAEA
jgi:hypothetical protein